jgi:protein associated with RNAse G/E
MMKPVDVVKLDHQGRELFRYPGWVLAQDEHSITLEAFFSWEDTLVKEVILQRGDRFVETYFSDRWYNIFEIYGRDSGQLKAYYCNIGYPALIADGMVSYRDLALDLLVLLDGRQYVLDEDEFQQLDLPQEPKRMALAGLAAVQQEVLAKIAAAS